jgi:hypothetical protein
LTLLVPAGGLAAGVLVGSARLHETSAKLASRLMAQIKLDAFMAGEFSRTGGKSHARNQIISAAAGADHPAWSW